MYIYMYIHISMSSYLPMFLLVFHTITIPLPLCQYSMSTVHSTLNYLHIYMHMYTYTHVFTYKHIHTYMYNDTNIHTDTHLHMQYTQLHLD